MLHIFRVKKPDEFNRPRIPYSQRKIKTRSSKFLSKKVKLDFFWLLNNMIFLVLAFEISLNIFVSLFSVVKKEERYDQT